VPLSPLELPGWLEFNGRRSELEVERYSTLPDNAAEDATGLRAVFYLDRKGKLRLPATNPYMSVVFQTGRGSPSGRTATWHRAAAGLVDQMRKRGVGNQLYLPPDINDVRPWLWRGFLVNVRYTYYLDFPAEASVLGRSAKADARAAAKAGLTVERVTDVDPVVECLEASEARRGFKTHLGIAELRSALSCMGEDSLRMYVCRDPAGRPTSTAVMLHSPGSRAISWAGGTKSESLGDGAAYAGLRFAFDDLESAGASGVDLCGANAPAVAAFKSHFGGRLLPNYGVRTYSIRTAARFGSDWLAARKAPAPGPSQG
jgi:hypothetical protein